MQFISEPRSWHFFYGQPQFLRDIGYEFIAVSSPGELLDRFAEVNGVEAHPVSVTRKLSVLSDLVSVIRLLRVLRKVRPDILHAHFTKPGLIGMVAGFLARVPVRIYHNHGMALSSARGWKRWILWAAERTSCTLAHRVIYVAPSVLRDALKNRVCSAGKAITILSANGLDTETRFDRSLYDAGLRERQRLLLNIPPGAFVVGYVGRILKIKGIEELVRAWQLLAPSEPQLHLLLVGEFDPRDPVSAEIEKLMRSEPRIHLAGFVEEPATAYVAMDVLVLPSYHEGLGYSLLEASAMELPVIGTRIPGIVDAVRENVTGLLIDARVAAQLARAIRIYKDDPALASEFGKAGRELVVSQFQRAAVWDSLRHTYEGLIAERSQLGATTLSSSH
jgi:glycosyltransferase involved in cell wall biosynthesis